VLVEDGLSDVPFMATGSQHPSNGKKTQLRGCTAPRRVLCSFVMQWGEGKNAALHPTKGKH
jgi:hypothetical protein